MPQERRRTWLRPVAARLARALVRHAYVLGYSCTKKCLIFPPPCTQEEEDGESGEPVVRPQKRRRLARLNGAVLHSSDDEDGDEEASSFFVVERGCLIRVCFALITALLRGGASLLRCCAVLLRCGRMRGGLLLVPRRPPRPRCRAIPLCLFVRNGAH